MLYLKEFNKQYGGTTVLDIPSLSFSPGIYWIKGENGSGKSTLFKSIAGILPHRGSISFHDGTDQRSHPVEFRRRVNYSEAEPLFPGFLTAKDMIRFVGAAKGAAKHSQDAVAEKMGVTTFLNQPCETYSSGMLKKLSLALAFLGEPQVIILDEPLITLDESARDVLWTMIEAGLKQEIIFLLSSHQLLERQSVSLNATYLIRNKTLEAV